ncbi:MAG: NAD+ synthase [Steroidobacteraceae bacterium]
MRIALGQVDCFVGDVPGNEARILQAVERARAQGARLLLLPELALSGYPPEDLLFHRGFRHRIDAALERLRQAIHGIDVVVGYPEYEGDVIYNSAVVLSNGDIKARHRKLRLPNYQVFDEKRYFEVGSEATCFEVDGTRVGLLICEDAWTAAPALALREAGAQLIAVINASPYEQGKQSRREAVLAARARETSLPVVYVNLVGGQDELVFDGGSCALDALGNTVHRTVAFDESFTSVELTRSAAGPCSVAGTLEPLLADEASVYQAIVTGIRDYVDKHRFPGAIIGLSGGIDSALVLTLAVDALGAQRVKAVMMPSRYTSDMSREDAERMAEGLGVAYSVLPIEPMFEATLATLAGEFAGRAADATEENIQARCRGILLMALSNKTGALLLTTGNKSEMAVGYATLYGDMAGGFAPIKDCSKQLVYRLARWRNRDAEVIPTRIIEREPSAELRADQKDSDSLPPYPVLDAILEAFIERDLSVEEIVALGFERGVVVRILEMVRRNEYKRRQAPPGVRVSARAFGRDWRYPITSGYRNEPR